VSDKTAFELRRLTLAYLFERVSKGNLRFATVPVITKALGYNLSRQFVRTLLDDLEFRGLVVTRSNNAQGKNFYQITAEGIDAHNRSFATNSIDSTNWTGLPTNFVLTQELQAKLVADLDRAEQALQFASISQHERSQARAYIIAMRTLAEAPEPQADLIWEMLARLNQMAGIASLFVSIIALFASVSI
jgi:DNA-binding PadR family transcriptional regulator